MTAAEILKKHLGGQQLGPQTSVKVGAAMEEYGNARHYEGTLDSKADMDTWKRLLYAKDAKIRELEEKLITIKNTVNA